MAAALLRHVGAQAWWNCAARRQAGLWALHGSDFPAVLRLWHLHVSGFNDTTVGEQQRSILVHARMTVAVGGWLK
jgi:hypothetical protein